MRTILCVKHRYSGPAERGCFYCERERPVDECTVSVRGKHIWVADNETETMAYCSCECGATTEIQL